MWDRKLHNERQNSVVEPVEGGLVLRDGFLVRVAFRRVGLLGYSPVGCCAPEVNLRREGLLRLARQACEETGDGIEAPCCWRMGASRMPEPALARVDNVFHTKGG